MFSLIHQVNKFTIFYRTGRFFNMFTKAYHSILYWACSIQSTLQQCILIIRIHPLFGHKVVARLQVFCLKFCKCLTCAACLIHRILLQLIALMMIDEEHELWSFPLRRFLHSPISSSLPSPNVLFGNLFCNTLYIFPPVWGVKIYTDVECQSFWYKIELYKPTCCWYGKR